MARIDSLLALLLEQGGSDLHVSAGIPALARVHGDLRALAGQVLSTDAVRALILELLPADAKTTFEAGSEVECSYAMQGGPRFRIHAFLGHRGPAAVIRHVPAAPPELEKLGLPRVVQDICKAQRGLVVVAGPSGSGQSTTLAAMIDEINRTRCQHIVTIEDPIEFVHANKSSFITQRQVRTHCRSTEQAVRAALHEDPDVLLVSAAGDVETIRAALDAAVSGKLVLAGMPTLTARKTVERLIDACQISACPMSPEKSRVLIADVLQAVIVQVLLRQADGEGRVPVNEVLVNNRHVSDHIRAGALHQIVLALQAGAWYGMSELNDSLLRLVSRGAVAPSEAFGAAYDKQVFLRGARVAGISFDPASLQGTIGALAVGRAT